MPNRILATLLILFTASSSMAAGTCWSVFRKTPKIDPAITWRAGTTVHALSAAGERVVIPTNPAREAKLQRQAKTIHQAIYEIGDGPWLYFTEAPSVTLKQTQHAVYQTGKYPKYDVMTGGAPTMRATFSLGPSGHVGSTLKEKIKNSEHYAATDRIFFWATIDGQRIDIVRELKSMGLTTFLDLEIPLVAGKEVKIFYARY
ncbi:MAG: hypothetical protein AAB250_10470, partial [Bdellovibrionota bacterium]